MRVTSTMTGRQSVPAITIQDALPCHDLTINLKQWRTLHAVVTYGSFGNAATALGMSQPAVSYTIAKMEEQLGVVLLRQEGRRAQLTDKGVALLERAGGLLRDAFELENYVNSIKQGLGPQFQLAVDRGFPTRSLFAKLRNFSVLGRPARIELIEVSGTKVTELLRNRSVDLAISDHIPADLTGEYFADAEHVLVASPNHRLSRLDRPLFEADLEREVEVALVSEFELSDPPPRRHALTPPWRVSNFDTAETALLDGVGYGWMPRHRIEGLLRSNRLTQLTLATLLPSSPPRKATYYLVYPRPLAQGSEGYRLAQFLAERA